MAGQGDRKKMGAAHPFGVGCSRWKNRAPLGRLLSPQWDGGNFSFLADGSEDRKPIGVDGIKGTAPVGSFKPNALGFGDLAGNVWEWTAGQSDPKTGNRMLRGAGWETPTAGHDFSHTSYHWSFPLTRSGSIRDSE